MEAQTGGNLGDALMDLFIRYNAPVCKAVHPATSSSKNEHSKISSILMLVLLIYLLTGCIQAPASYRPRTWEHAPIDMKAITDLPGQSLLQVIIVYGHWSGHHTALRLVSPDRPVVFWDPGGRYGHTFPKDVRSKDLITVNPPDLEMYLQQHIWNRTSVEVEVFEWDLKPEYARELYDILVNGTDKDHPAGRFTTTGAGLLCTYKVSDFLHRFAGKTIRVSKPFFRPHNLAKVLYTQSPKRVLSFRRGKQTVYDPSPMMNPPSPVGGH
jgi:hypothetical protein